MPFFKRSSGKGKGKAEKENKKGNYNKYNKSLLKILEKIEREKKKGETKDIAPLYQEASVLAGSSEEWNDSIKYAVMAAEESEKKKKLFDSAWSYRSAAMAAAKNRDCANAVKYALLGAERFKKSGSLYAAKWCYKTAAKACEECGDYERAVRMYDKAYAVEPDEETGSSSYRLKHLVSHPKVDQYAEKGDMLENDPVRFEIVVENHSKNTLSDVVVGGKDGRISHDAGTLKPGDVHVFSYETAGKMGWMHSPYDMITWKDEKGRVSELGLEPASVMVRPRVQANSHINPDLVVNKKSELVITVKNLSSSPVYDVAVDVDFFHRIKSERLSPQVFKKISPGEEIGTEWDIVPVVLGKQKILEGKIEMRDENGNEYEETIEPFFSAVAEKEGEVKKKVFEKHEEFMDEKKSLKGGITAFSLSEKDYVSLTKKLWHRERGFTLRKAGVDVATEHVKENCKGMHLVSKHDFKHEKLLLYSFQLEGSRYLLSVIVKEEEGLTHLILKLYSENRESLIPTLDRIADIVSYTITTETDAREVERVEIKKIINITDSIVQRSDIATGGDEGEVKEKETKIKDSIVQRTKV